MNKFTGFLPVLFIIYQIPHFSVAVAAPSKTITKALTAEPATQTFDMDDHCPKHWLAKVGDASCHGNSCSFVHLQTTHSKHKVKHPNKVDYNSTNNQNVAFQLKFKCYAPS